MTVLKPAVGKNVVVRKKRMTEMRNIESVVLHRLLLFINSDCSLHTLFVRAFSGIVVSHK